MLFEVVGHLVAGTEHLVAVFQASGRREGARERAKEGRREGRVSKMTPTQRWTYGFLAPSSSPSPPPPISVPRRDIDRLSEYLVLDDMGHLEGALPARVGVVEVEHLEGEGREEGGREGGREGRGFRESGGVHGGEERKEEEGDR